jgi:hypothetical protein
MSALVVVPLVALAAGAAQVAIEVGAEPADADCPTRASVSQALEQRLGDGAGRTPWRLRYQVVPDVAGEREVEVALLSPAGQPALRRQLRVASADCALGAEAVAIVVEEYFRGVGWSRGQPLPPATPVAPPAVVAAPAARLPAPQGGPRLVLAAGAAGGIDTSAWARPRISARVRLFGPVHLGVASELPGRSRTQPVGAGEARLSSWPVSLSVPLVYRWPRLELEAGPEVALTLDFASSRAVSRPASQQRTTLAIGAGVALAVPLAGRWRVLAGLAGHRGVLGSELVFNQTSVVLPIPRWRGLVHVGVGREIF